MTQPTNQRTIAGAWGDYDNDGKPDLCVACIGGVSTVYRNLGNGQFESADIGLTLGGGNSASWADYDNDGFLDLFFTHPNALYHNNGDGTFKRVTTGSILNDTAISGGLSYSGLWFDYDNDGFLDLYVFNGNDAATALTANFLYHNNGNSNSWLKVRLIGTVSNRDGVGAKVRALAIYAGKSRWQRRDISAGDGINGNQLYAPFGLGDAKQITTLRIERPPERNPRQAWLWTLFPFRPAGRRTAQAGRLCYLLLVFQTGSEIFTAGSGAGAECLCAIPLRAKVAA